MNKLLSCSNARAHTHSWRGRKCATFLLLAAVVFSLTAATANAASSVSPAASATQASHLTGATTHPIQYAIAGPPSMIDDGSSLAYFKAHGFSTVQLIASNNGTYQTELNTIKALGMQPVIDVELVIWNGGQITSPISSFNAYFQSLKNAGWDYVASEGGRSGDPQYIQSLGLQYINYNCDQCGLWKDTYLHANENLWESYYTSEWPYIQTGATQAAALGIQNGILAGVWPNTGGVNQILANSLNGNTPSYKSMLDWSYANGIGFNQFCVWDANATNPLGAYEQLGFPQIVANLQTYYPASLASGWGWSKIGGQLLAGTSPAAYSFTSGTTTQVGWFVTGTDHALYQSWSNNGVQSPSWVNLGGYLTSSPAATSPGNGVIDVFVRGTNGALYERTTTNGGATWSSWASLGGQIPAGTAPAASSWGSGHLDLFVQGMNGALYHKSYSGSTWSAWENLGGKLTSSPAATSPGNGQINVFVRGTNGALYQRSWTGSWSSWTSLGGQIPAGTAPAASSWGSGHLDLFVQGMDGALYHMSATGSTWSSWENLGGYLTSSPAATSPASGVIDVFVCGTDGALWQGT
ncbi:MAG: hypothetical protein ABSB81_05605 [Halobacteriota archaeon]